MSIEMNTEMNTEPEQIPPQLEAVEEPMQETGAENAQMEGPEPRPQAIYISGVNDLSQEQVQEYGYKWLKYPFVIEWINDTSLNLVFDTPKEASEALRSLTPKESKETPKEELRAIKSHPTVPEASLEARMATTEDVKSSGSAQESKYYKKHGAPSREDRRIRFGTGRSEPMKYSRGDIFKTVKKGRNSGSTDLFPHLAKGQPADDLFPHLAGGGGDDLFPHLVPSGGAANGGIGKKSSRNSRRRSGRGRNGNRGGNAMEIEDLIPNPTGGSAPALATESTEKPATVYSNMDY